MLLPHKHRFSDVVYLQRIYIFPLHMLKIDLICDCRYCVIYCLSVLQKYLYLPVSIFYKPYYVRMHFNTKPPIVLEHTLLSTYFVFLLSWNYQCQNENNHVNLAFTILTFRYAIMVSAFQAVYYATVASSFII